MEPERRHHPSGTLQARPEAMSDREWDVIIIGAGPAGSTAATLLARRNYRVLLLDKTPFPREKVCGDILLPDTMTVLDRLGLGQSIRSQACSLGSIRGVSTGGTEFLVAGEYHSLVRERFDSLLVEESVRSGAVFVHGDAVSVANSTADECEVCLRSGQKLRSRYVLIATGADAQLAREAGLCQHGAVNAVALRCYVRSGHRIDEGVLCYHKEISPGYAWIFPLGDGRYNVGCGVTLSDRHQFNLKKMYQRFTAEYPPARDLLARGQQVTHLGGAAIRFGLINPAQTINGRILAIGETIGTTLPFTGEGIGTAMQSAEMAAEAVHRALAADDVSQLNSFKERLEEFTPLFRGYRAAQRWLRSPWINDLAARRIRSSPYLRELCAGVLAGTVDPAEIYSLRGILRSLWK